MILTDDYTRGVADGIRMGMALVEAGAEPPEIVAVLPGGPPADLDAYQNHLRELRLAMGLDAVSGGHDV